MLRHKSGKMDAFVEGFYCKYNNDNCNICFPIIVSHPNDVKK